MDSKSVAEMSHDLSNPFLISFNGFLNVFDDSVLLTLRWWKWPRLAYTQSFSMKHASLWNLVVLRRVRKRNGVVFFMVGIPLERHSPEISTVFDR